MEYIRLGATGTQVSRICLGCMTYVTMQDHYNLINREEEREMLPLCLVALACMLSRRQ